MSLGQRTRKLSQRGDTIVEVMIVLAVLGLAIGISYATANRSLLLTRAAQENTKAAQLLQSQIERLRSLSDNTDPAVTSKYIFQNASTYCVDGTNTIIQPATTGSPPNTVPNPLCKVDSLYSVSITYCNGLSVGICTGHGTDDTFILTATWEDIQGNGNDTVTTTYRLHKPDPPPPATIPSDTAPPVPGPPINFYADSYALTSGQSAIFHLDGSAASFCTSSPNITGGAKTGTFTTGPLSTGSYTYTVTCTGSSGGVSTVSQTITVSNVTPPTCPSGGGGSDIVIGDTPTNPCCPTKAKIKCIPTPTPTPTPTPDPTPPGGTD